MTRAAVALLEGRWAEATLLHPLVWVVVPVAGLGWTVSTARIARGRPLPKVPVWAAWALAGALTVVWALRLSGWWMPHPDWHF